MVKMRFMYIFIIVLFFAPFLQAELGLTIVGGFNRANVLHEESEMQVWLGDLKAPAFGIERKIGPVVAAIGDLKRGYINGYSDIDTTLSISYINTQSYYPLNFGKFVFLAGINIGAPLSAIKTYSSEGSTKVDIEELNISHGNLLNESKQLENQLKEDKEYKEQLRPMYMEYHKKLATIDEEKILSDYEDYKELRKDLREIKNQL